LSALEAYRRAPEERDRLILEHLPQVNLIARRIHEKIQGRVDLDDLVSAGTIGLIAAIDRFDPERQLQLKTYAEYKIRGAMLDTLRSLDGLSRDERKRTKAIGTARTSVERRLQRTATHEEIADEAGITLKEYSDVLTAPGAETPLSLDAEVQRTDGDVKLSDVVRDSGRPSPEQALVESELRSFVSQAIDELAPTHKSVITLHYAHGLTMRKIAPMLNLSEWQVQEARRKGIVELRMRLAEVGVAASSVPDLVSRG
jgi:RNA polymerase sigma factor for flagellar operon FliA